MKLIVTIEGKTFTAELENLNTRPVVVRVDGEPFEVWPEEQATRLPIPPDARHETDSTKRDTGAGRSANDQHSASASTDHVLRAPIPGVIESVSVRVGDEVTTGQPVCVLEAMKMKNVIRANRDGLIAEVRVSAGQQVNHSDVLLVFGDQGNP